MRFYSYICRWCVVLVVIFFHHAAQGQYYSWGADRANLRWSRIKNNNFSVIYPDSAEFSARSLNHYVGAAAPYISYGYDYSALKMPFVIHPDNFQTNGMVMWAPRRIEILSTPDEHSYSMIWLKQLAVHEYRHAVQYNNLNRSTLKWLTYILGEQGATIGLLLPPLYAIEGDAVMMETQASTYGRGLQPSFTIGYRAMGDEIANPRNLSKLLCGSYKEHIPDHYRLGYQVLSYAYDKYNENILNKIFWYSSRNPYFIVPYGIALSKYYDTSERELISESFSSLNNFWNSLPNIEPSSRILSEIDTKNYTTYQHPQPTSSGKLLALKSDYDTPSHFVEYDPISGEERQVAYTGRVSSRPAYAADRVWWSEYRRSMLFAEDVDSQICYMDLSDGKPKRLKGFKSALYPTPIGESINHIAYVDYNISKGYSVVELVDGVEQSRVELPLPNEIHSLAWDNTTKALYVIITGNDGMWISRVDEDGFTPLTKAAYITISNLRACDGKLYFGSIASGRDEAHSLDLASGEQSQLSASVYGSFEPAKMGDSLYMTTYDRYGYHISSQSIEHKVAKVAYSNTPKNIVNPLHKKWNVINIDTVQFDTIAMSNSKKQHKSKRYYKAAHLANVHSWVPLSMNPYRLLSEMDLNFDLGATLISQNLLSSCDGFLSYGWSRDAGSVVRLGANYDGLGVDLGLSATYGGLQNSYLINYPNRGVYKDLNISASLPMFFQRGYRTRQLSPYLSWNYSNGIIPKGLSTIQNSEGEYFATYQKMVEGLNKMTIGVTYSDYVRAAYRDVDVPKGMVLSASYSSNLLNSDFSQLLSLYAKVYTPGFGVNDSFTLAGGYQNTYGGYKWLDGSSLLGYKSSVLAPRGYDYTDLGNSNYYAVSANYQFPLCYPEINITPIMYVKRLRINIGADYAEFDAIGSNRTSLYSCGFDLISDINIISMSSASSTSLKLSLYKPYDKGLYFQVGLGLPF